MEIEYILAFEKPLETKHIIVRNDIIINSDKDIISICVGKNFRNFLEQLFVWGRTFRVYNRLVGLTDIIDFINLIEELFESYIPKPMERTYVKLLYPDGHFGFIEYDGSEEDRFRIIKEHTDLFGRKQDIDLSLATAGDLKKIVPKNRFEFKFGE